MNVMDSSCWIEYFSDLPLAKKFAEPIEDVENLIVPSVTITEVFRKVLKDRDEDTALKVIAHMWQGAIVDLDENLALRAGSLGHRFKLPMIDSIILATAQAHGATLWTMDSDFHGMPSVKFFSKSKKETH